MSFFLFKRKSLLSFVFDIRDSSVTVSAVKFEKNKKPEMILCQRNELRDMDAQDHKKYLSCLLRTIDKTMLSVRKNLVKIGDDSEVGSYYFFIGSPWSMSQAKTVKIVRDRPFEINDEIVGKVLVNEESSMESVIAQETHINDWTILEEKIVQAKLNGYKVNNIFGKKTSNLAVELFVSYVPKDLKDKLDNHFKEKTDKNINKQNNSTISSSYSFFRDLYSNKNDFIYVDIGKFITDIYVVRDDIIFGIASFPYGEENIIQTSLSKTNLTREVFMSHINIGQDKKFDLPSHNRGSDLLRSGFDTWKEKLKTTLAKICTEMNIPNTIFMITNNVLSNILAKDISDKENGKSLELLGSKIDVSIIGEGMTNNFIDNAKSFLNEPYVKMDIIFLDKMLNNN